MWSIMCFKESVLSVQFPYVSWVIFCINDDHACRSSVREVLDREQFRLLVFVRFAADLR
jgi:hypothetical protein